MNVEFSKSYKNIITRAGEIAQHHACSAVSPDHLLLAMLEAPDCSAVARLRAIGVNLDSLIRELNADESDGKAPLATAMPLKFDNRVRLAFASSFAEALEAQSQSIRTLHLLIGIAMLGDESPSSIALRSRGASPERLRAAE